MGSREDSAGRAETVMAGSLTRYSFLKAASISAQTAWTAPASAATRATEAVGMALSFRPPLTEITRRGVLCSRAHRTRPSSMLLLARPLSISAPE